MIVSKSSNFIFARVPKTASTSIVETLYGHRRLRERSRLTSLVRRLSADRWPDWAWAFASKTHLSMSAAQVALPRPFFNQAFKFAVVRHPYDRHLSQFHHILRNQQDPVFRAIYPGVYSEPSFESYIWWRASTTAPMPQTAQLVDQRGRFLVNEVIRYEELDARLPAILNQLGIEDSLRQRNIGDYSRHSVRSPEVLALIREIDAADFSHFGYQSDGELGPIDLTDSPESVAIGERLRSWPIQFTLWDTPSRHPNAKG